MVELRGAVVVDITKTEGLAKQAIPSRRGTDQLVRLPKHRAGVSIGGERYLLAIRA